MEDKPRDSGPVVGLAHVPVDELPEPVRVYSSQPVVVFLVVPEAVKGYSFLYGGPDEHVLGHHRVHVTVAAVDEPPDHPRG